MQRAAVSIPSNIAEGYMRGQQQEFIRYNSIALGSAAELETQLIICQSLHFDHDELVDKSQRQLKEIVRMLLALIKKLKSVSS